MQPLTSVISGVLDQAETRLKSTGPLPGASGSVRSLTESALRARLVAQKPEDTDRNLLAWLASSLSVVAKPRSRMMFPKTGGYYARPDGFDIAGLDQMNRHEALAAVEAAMTRPTVEQCEELIASLHAVTARRGDDAEGQMLAMALYAGCLAQYPADIAKAVCMAFAIRKASPNWFPTLSEINEACEKAAAQRALLLHALKTAMPPPSARQEAA